MDGWKIFIVAAIAAGVIIAGTIICVQNNQKLPRFSEVLPGVFSSSQTPATCAKCQAKLNEDEKCPKCDYCSDCGNLLNSDGTCPKCDFTKKRCRTCMGRGYLIRRYENMIDKHSLDSTAGYTEKQPCEACNGDGYIYEKKKRLRKSMDKARR